MKLTFNQKLIFGALVLGIGFPVMAFCISIFQFNFPCSFSSIAKIHNKVIAIYLIDLAPFILPLVAYSITVIVDKQNRKRIDTINKQIEKSKKIEHFVQEIGNGNYEDEFSLAKENDSVGLVLEKLRTNLKTNEIENKQRLWLNEGIAKFSDILRENESLDKLCSNILKELVVYLEANQGGVFVVNHDMENPLMEQKACYAYDRVKMAQKKIMQGEGVIGQAWLEREFVYMTDLPQKYVSITSGIGEATPENLLVVPLISNDVVEGAIEIASFKILEHYEIDFVKHISENIASTIANVRSNERTKKLLEQQQEQSEQLQAQEEELRQNMEEIQATNEQVERSTKDTEAKNKELEESLSEFQEFIQEQAKIHDQKEIEFENFRKEIEIKNNEIEGSMKVINKSAIVSRTDKKGIITFVNDLFCKVAGYTREELIGQNHNIIRHPDMPPGAFKGVWKTIGKGSVWSGKVKNKTKDGGYYWVDANIGPIFGEDGKPKEYIGVRYLITSYIDDNKMLDELNKTFPLVKEEAYFLK